MIHQLKIDSNYFEDVVSGKKTFEVRNNDRNFVVGDFLALNETAKEVLPFDNDIDNFETGRCCIVLVNYILNDPAYCKEGYVVLGIEACSINVLGVGYESEIYDSICISKLNGK